MAVIFVTHDVGVAVEVADRIAVMYAGRFVETGADGRGDLRAGAPLYRRPAGLDRAGAAHGQRLEAIPGAPPDMTRAAAGLQLRAALPLRRRAVRP